MNLFQHERPTKQIKAEKVREMGWEIEKTKDTAGDSEKELNLLYINTDYSLISSYQANQVKEKN